MNENTNNKTLLYIVGVAAILGVLMLGASVLRPADAREAGEGGGVAAKVTPRICDFMVVEGQTYMFCDGGYEGRALPFATPQSAE